ncbi:MAG: cell wall-binding repeat-containing protein, partial [Lachnospiraceae bacterium]|nr:cell wall-binding repeat-containing protein [Candidatus Equihabitans merdae]
VLATPAPRMNFSGVVSWDAIEGANTYMLSLVNASGEQVTSQITSRRSYNFSAYMADRSTYKCYVTASDSNRQHQNSERGASEWVTYYAGEYLGVWVGNVPVTTANRNDVLNDGGHVQLLADASTYHSDLNRETLVLSYVGVPEGSYHTTQDGHRAKLTIEKDLAVWIGGDVCVSGGPWEDEKGGLDGIYIAPGNFVSFYGHGYLTSEVSTNGGSGIYAPGGSINFFGEMQVDLSGYNGFYSDFAGGNLGGLFLYEGTRFYATGSGTGFAVESPEIVVNDYASFYAEQTQGRRAVETWGEIYSYHDDLTIRGLRTDARDWNWDALGDINTSSTDHESLFRILEIESNDHTTRAFKHERYSGDDRFLTAKAIAEAVKAEYGSINCVTLANAYNFPDALTGSVLSAYNQAPILLVGSDPASNKIAVDFIVKNLDEEGKVYMLGGQAAVPASVESQLRAAGYKGELIRLGGQTRYETNVLINRELDPWPGTDVIVASGTGFADSLAISGIAGSRGMPIFLTAQDCIESIILDEIREIDPERIYIVGGTAAVSKGVEAELARISPVRRIWGETRFETCQRISTAFACNFGQMAVVANGQNFPDALAGSVLASIYDMPIILVNNDAGVSEIQRKYLANSNIRDLIVVGGQAAVSNTTLATLEKKQKIVFLKNDLHDVLGLPLWVGL